jgi:hypothetical protein
MVHDEIAVLVVVGADARSSEVGQDMEHTGRWRVLATHNDEENPPCGNVPGDLAVVS